METNCITWPSRPMTVGLPSQSCSLVQERKGALTNSCITGQQEPEEVKLQVRAKGSRGPSGESQAIGFINISNPDDDKDPKRRRQVRSHVLRNYHARRRKGQVNVPVPQRKGKKDVSSSPDQISVRTPEEPDSALLQVLPGWCKNCNALRLSSCSAHDEEWSLVSSGESSTGHLTPGPLSPLGAGRVDPFASYPRPVSLDEHMLVDHCKD
jgi:hypothetical protein